MERLDIVDDNGNPTDETVDRADAHARGIQHRTAHVWLIREKNGVLEVLLQKRSADKDSYPGCWDISSAGHIPAGQGFRESAVRELREELGVEAEASALVFCGLRRFSCDGLFHAEPFHDRQVSAVYALACDPEHFVLQDAEVAEVRWINIQDAFAARPNCIFPEELEMVRRAGAALFEVEA